MTPQIDGNGLITLDVLPAITRLQAIVTSPDGRQTAPLTEVKQASTIVRLAVGSGTLVIESLEPGIMIAIDGEEIAIQGGGVKEMTLRPGDYQIAALKDGRPVKQELVTITRNGRTLVRMTFEGQGRVAKAADESQTVDRIAALPLDQQVAAVAAELDATACATLRANRGWPVIERDIFDVPTEEMLAEGGLARGEADLLIGGP